MTLNDTFQLVKRALDAGRPATGYLIVGPVRGVGFELALKILQALFCTSENKPCGSCEGCRKVREHIEPDVHWIYPAKKTRIISAEQIREQLIAPIMQTSFGGGWKVGVLVGADRLNDASANAFLKTLEEPPDKTLFLLLSDAPQQLLPTIISRCQRIDLTAFRQLSEPWFSSVLETLSGTYYTRVIDRMVSANMLFQTLADMKAKAEEWVKEENSKQTKNTEEDDDDLFNAKVSARYRELRDDFLLMLMRWYRDLLIVKGGTAEVVYFKEKVDILKERAERITLAQALYNVEAIEEMARQFERNLNEETVLAYTMDRIHHGVGARH